MHHFHFKTISGYPKRYLFAQFFHFHLVSSHPKITENTALYELAILPKSQNT